MTDINLLLKNLMASLLEADDLLNEFAGSDPDLKDLGATVVELHAIKSAMSDVYSTFSAKAVRLFEQAEVLDMALGESRIEIRGAADRKQWEHPRLMAEVARRLVFESIDMETGEVIVSPEQLIVKVLEFVQPSYWRIKELSKIGINADKFCEVGEHKTNIIVRKAK